MREERMQKRVSVRHRDLALEWRKLYLHESLTLHVVCVCALLKGL